MKKKSSKSLKKYTPGGPIGPGPKDSIPLSSYYMSPDALAKIQSTISAKVADEKAKTILRNRANPDPGFTITPKGRYVNPDPGFSITPKRAYKNPDPGFFINPKLENKKSGGSVGKSKKKK